MATAAKIVYPHIVKEPGDCGGKAVDGPVVKALRAAAWDILRGIDAYPEKTRDHVHFARAAQEGRVLVSNDIDMKAIAEAWLLEGSSFPGNVRWPIAAPVGLRGASTS